MSGSPKVHILFDIVDTAAGGGNQFLKALRDYLRERDLYAVDRSVADIILINSHHQLLRALTLKIFNRRCVFIHRIDGPITFSGRRDGRYLDRFLFKANETIADGSIFQSHYSRDMSIINGMILGNVKSIVAYNAPNPGLFYRKSANVSSPKVKLIATSWSSNPRKGFDVYMWLDKNLDFSLYDMVFIGNSPVTFSNIKIFKPMPPNLLAKELRQSDIFIFPSKVESCSNALLEALHCGLPVIAYKGSSNPEIVSGGGELFERVEDIPELLRNVVMDYKQYQKNIRLPTINEVGRVYYEFACEVFRNWASSDARKGLNVTSVIGVIKLWLLWKFNRRFDRHL